MKVKFEIPLGFFELFGTGSLVGALYNHFKDDYLKITEIELVFHKTSLSWKEKNSGPHISLMAEYVPFCFLEDILSLQKEGKVISISEKIKDPE